MSKCSDIILKDVSISFKKANFRAVNQINLTFKANAITGLIGESGSGKSLIAMSILKLLGNEATIDGQCLYGDTDLYQLTESEMRAVRTKDIAIIPQNPVEALNPVIKLKRQLTEPLKYHTDLTKQASLDLVKQNLKVFGFKDPEVILKSYPFEMSGGMNQRILSIMNILCGPNWVIADEPTKGLDAILKKKIYQRLKYIHDNHVNSMILITHDIYFARKFCDYIAILYKGDLLEYGKTVDVLTAPLHPYTEALLKALPDRGFLPIKKTAEQPSNCKYYNYCQHRSAKCQAAIKLNTIKSRKVKCIRYD